MNSGSSVPAAPRRRDVLLVCALALAGMPRANADGPPLTAPARVAKLDIEPVAAGRLPWVVFDERSGLPQHTIVDLIADPRGAVWAATQDGAARYDGRTWQTVPMPREMKTNYPRTMRLAADGGLWFGTFDGGLAHLLDGKWTVFGASSGLPSNRIRGVLETKRERGGTGGARGTVVWVATDNGVARLENGRFTAFGIADGLPSLDTEGLGEVADEGGARSLHVGTANGLARFDGTRFQSVAVPSQLIGHRIQDIVESPGLGGGPALWLSSYGGGMAVREAGAWSVLDTSSGLPSNAQVITKSSARDGSPALSIATEGGLVRFEHGRFTLYDERCGLPIKIIWKALETTSSDGLRTIWLGTWGGGVLRLSENVWTAFDSSMGMPGGGVVTSVLATRGDDGAETIWAGTSDGFLGRLEGGRVTPVELPAALKNAIIFSLLETKENDGTRSLWVASFGGGLGRLTRGKWTLYDPKVLPNERVQTLFETRDEDGGSVLWVGTEGGLGRLKDGAWTFFRKGAELPGEVVTNLRETVRADGTRTLWVSTSGGLARLESGRWTVESRLTTKNIGALQLTTDPDGTRWIWACTFGGGASRLRLDDPGRGWETFSSTTRPALPSDSVVSVQQDRRGRIYLFTTRGVARLTPRAPTPDDPARFSVYTFTMEDGLPSSDCEPAASLVDASGRILTGTARGLARYDPSLEIPDVSKKPLVIERAALLGGGRALRGGEELSHRQRNLAFEYALLAWGRESRTRYRVQLLGFDAEPSDWTASGTKEYTNLGAGAYAFRVWGRDAAGNVSGPVSLPFAIEPAPWRTPLAWVLYVLFAAAAAYGTLRLRLSALSHRTRLLESMVEKRTTELAASEHRAQEASRAKSTFLASMSHELRTPLTGILGFAQLMDRRGGRDPEDRWHLGVILRSGEHLLGLVNGVLSLARIEAGGVEIDASTFEPARLARRVEEMLRVRAEAKGIALSCDLAPGLPAAVVGDEMKLRQVLLNLLGNAVKFTEKGSVTLRAAWADGRGAFEVVDTGPGIAPEEMRKLFAPFVQTETGRRSTEGTGLGLALSRQLARLMGGDITAESEPGRGSIFRLTVSLPAAPEEALIAVRAEERRVVALAPGQPAWRILVVDDVRDNRSLLSGLLGSVGYDVRTAANGAEALEQYRSWRPHLIWMDNRMPVMDGLEATRRIVSDTRERGASGVKIIVHSASVLAHEQKEILANGCDDFVAKPFREATVFAKTAEHLGARYVYEDAPEAPTAPAARASRRGEPPRAPRPSRSVLLVDDEPISRELARTLLERIGLDVAEAGDGREALTMLATSRYDAVLLDGEMPGLDGLETVREIRRREELRDLPVVAMTAHGSPGDRERFLAAGMSEHIAKPIEERELARVLGRWLMLDAPETRSGAAAAASADARSPLDVGGGVRRASGNAALHRRLLLDFLTSAREDVGRLAELLGRDDSGAASHLLHTMKGTAATLGARGIAAAAEAVEGFLKAAPPGDRAAQPPLGALHAAVEEAISSAGAIPDGPAPGSVRVEGALDAAAAKEALAIAARLSRHVAENDLAALSALAELKARLGSSLAPTLADLERCLDRLDFEAAGPPLARMSEALERDARAE